MWKDYLARNSLEVNEKKKEVNVYKSHEAC